MGNADGDKRSWIDKKTYDFLLGAMADPPNSQVIKVQGFITKDGVARLDPVWLLDGVEDIINQESAASYGEYDIQLQSADGEVLSSTKFGLAGTESSFSFSLGIKPGIAKIALIYQGNLLAEVTNDFTQKILTDNTG